MDSGTIINILLASISAILLAKIFQPVEIPIPYHKKPILIKNYSKKQLIKFNGKDSDSIYMAVSNLVFDVTAGKGFYGPDGVYGNFAGNDASRGLAKNSFDGVMINGIDQPIDSLSDLDDQERETLKEWTDFFTNKYTMIGYLVEQGFEDK